MAVASAARERGVVYPEDRLPWVQTILLGLQHVMAMFGATVLVPLILGFNPNTVIFFSGVATLIFLFVTGRKVPSYLGSSFSFLGAVLAIQGGSSGHHDLAYGGILIAGVIYFLIGVVVHFVGINAIRFLLPPVVTGTVVAVIGIALAGAAWNNFKGDLLTATVTVLVAVLVSVYLRGFPRMLPVLFAVVIGYVLALVDPACQSLKSACHISFSGVQSAAWVGFPTFSFPSFGDPVRQFSLFWFIPLILVAENAGHVFAISGIMKRDLSGYLGRTFMGDGIGTMVSALFGGTGETTYAENIGVMGVTRVFSIWIFIVAAVAAILLGFIPKFGALVDSIPSSVIGGIELYLFGLIAVIGAKIWVDGRVDFGKRANLAVAAVPLILAAGGADVKFGDFELNNLALGALGAIVLYQILRPGHMRDKESEPVEVVSS
jgi:putative pyrimidine permease RutG